MSGEQLAPEWADHEIRMSLDLYEWATAEATRRGHDDWSVLIAELIEQERRNATTSIKVSELMDWLREYVQARSPLTS